MIHHILQHFSHTYKIPQLIVLQEKREGLLWHNYFLFSLYLRLICSLVTANILAGLQGNAVCMQNVCDCLCLRCLDNFFFGCIDFLLFWLVLQVLVSSTIFILLSICINQAVTVLTLFISSSSSVSTIGLRFPLFSLSYSFLNSM